MLANIFLDDKLLCHREELDNKIKETVQEGDNDVLSNCMRLGWTLGGSRGHMLTFMLMPIPAPMPPTGPKGGMCCLCLSPT